MLEVEKERDLEWNWQTWGRTEAREERDSRYRVAASARSALIVHHLRRALWSFNASIDFDHVRGQMVAARHADCRPEIGTFRIW